MSETTPTWLYDDDGNGKVVGLAKGEKLPQGWHLKPPKGTHPHEREQKPKE